MSVRRRGKSWVADWYDATGRRRTKSCRTRNEAKEAEAKGRLEAKALRSPVVAPGITVADYAERWMALAGASHKPRTVDTYRSLLRWHILPTLGNLRVTELRRATIRTLLASKLKAGLAAGTVGLIHAALRSMLSSAVTDELLPGNPAAGLARNLRLRTKTDTEEIGAFDRAQLARFLAAAEGRPHFVLWYLLSRTGVRVGEGLALQWQDVHLEAGKLRVARTISISGRLGTPKTGHGRTVDLSPAAVEVLRAHRARATEDALRAGTEPLWLFPGRKGRPVPQRTVARAFKRILRLAGLPEHHSPKVFRHSFASILLSSGAPVQYVQQQLGHASVTMTVGTYGRWLRAEAPGALQALEEEPLAAAVAASSSIAAQDGSSMAANQRKIATGRKPDTGQTTDGTATSAEPWGEVPRTRSSHRPPEPENAESSSAVPCSLSCSDDWEGGS